MANVIALFIGLAFLVAESMTVPGSMSSVRLNGWLVPIDPRTQEILRVVCAVATVPCALLLISAFVPKRVTLGGDGLDVQWLGQRRFIPFREVTSVHEYKDNATFYFRSVRGVRLVHGRGSELIGIANDEDRERFREALTRRLPQTVSKTG